jgi:hypothetical protein
MLPMLPIEYFLVQKYAIAFGTYFDVPIDVFMEDVERELLLYFGVAVFAFHHCVVH